MNVEKGHSMGYFDEAPLGAVSKAEFAYRTLRDNILNNTYPPGTVLYIRELSTQLDVSRTPVKEAINRLAYEGYVDLFPERYAVVSRISYADVVELLELRECLESAASYYAALRRTDEDIAQMQRVSAEHRQVPFEQTAQLTGLDKEFHMAIARAPYNRQLIQTLQNVFVKLARVTLPISKQPNRFQDSLVQHDSVFAAIVDGNADAAKRQMSIHVRDILTSVKVYQYQNIHLFK